MTPPIGYVKLTFNSRPTWADAAKKIANDFCGASNLTESEINNYAEKLQESNNNVENPEDAAKERIWDWTSELWNSTYIEKIYVPECPSVKIVKMQGLRIVELKGLPPINNKETPPPPHPKPPIALQPQPKEIDTNKEKYDSLIIRIQNGKNGLTGADIQKIKDNLYYFSKKELNALNMEQWNKLGSTLTELYSVGKGKAEHPKDTDEKNLGGNLMGWVKAFFRPKYIQAKHLIGLFASADKKTREIALEIFVSDFRSISDKEILMSALQDLISAAKSDNKDKKAFAIKILQNLKAETDGDYKRLWSLTLKGESDIKIQIRSAIEDSRKIEKSEGIIAFCKAHKGKYRYDDALHTIVVRGQMMPEEKEKLLKIVQTPSEKAEIELIYQKGQECIKMCKEDRKTADKAQCECGIKPPPPPPPPRSEFCINACRLDHNTPGCKCK